MKKMFLVAAVVASCMAFTSCVPHTATPKKKAATTNTTQTTNTSTNQQKVAASSSGTQAEAQSAPSNNVGAATSTGSTSKGRKSVSK